MKREEIRCKILYRTNNINSMGRLFWHEPYLKDATIIRYVISNDPLFHAFYVGSFGSVTKLIIDGDELEVDDIHRGIDGTVVAIFAKSKHGYRTKFYTDILTDAGKKERIGRIMSKHYYSGYRYNTKANPECHVR